MVSLEIRFTVPENIQDLLLKIKKYLKDFQSKRLQKVTKDYSNYFLKISFQLKIRTQDILEKKSKKKEILQSFEPKNLEMFLNIAILVLPGNENLLSIQL